MTLRLARPGQGRLVARAIARSFDPALLPFTIWRSPRAGRYVEELLEDPRWGFYLLWSGRALTGMAVFREFGGRAFLNHLAIGRRWRGRGWGRRLLAEALRRYRTPRGEVALDAFAGGLAEGWYRRLGFVEESRRDWYTGPLVRPLRRLSALPVTGLEAAARDHQARGFSSFVAGPYTVGRLWTPYYRLTDPAAARDPDLACLLGALEAGRRLLLVAGAPRPSSRWRRLARSHRLVCSADLLQERLR
jgi:ribosomal protein S18 acetylase RimI-like enzyme